MRTEKKHLHSTRIKKEARGDPEIFRKLGASKDILIHITKFGLRRYHYSELSWAKDQLGFVQAANYVPTADEATRAYETKIKELVEEMICNDEQVARYTWSYVMAHRVLLDITETDVWNIWVDSFDPRLSFPSKCFE